MAQIAQHVAVSRPTFHRHASFKSWSMSSSALTHLAPEQTGRNNKQTRCTFRGLHSGYEYSRSFFYLRPGWGLPSREEQIPAPREASPDPTIPQSGEFARPCPHCIPGNRFGWQCPNPVPDPTSDQEHAWPMDEGSPPGHACCGNWCALFSSALTH